MSNKKRLIDANALLEKIQFRLPVDDHISECIDECVKKVRQIINDTPTVDAVEVVHGHWIECEGTVCSECNKHFFTDGPLAVSNYYPNYCPNCGAKMDGGVKQ